MPPYATDKALQTVVARLAAIIADMAPLRQQAQRSTVAKVAGQPSSKEQARTHRVEFAEFGTLLQDRLIRQLRKYERRAPAFYARVVAARTIVDHPGSATSAGTKATV